MHLSQAWRETAAAAAAGHKDSEHVQTRPQPLFTLLGVSPATHALVASLAGIAAADGTQAAPQ